MGPKSLLGGSARLRKPERVTLLVIVFSIATVDLVSFFRAGEVASPQVILSILTTLAFTLYIWSPLVATSAIGVAVAFSLLTPEPVSGFVAAAAAAGLVLRLGSGALFIGYTGGLLVFTASYVRLHPINADVSANVILALILTFVSGGIGLALRAANARETRYERELAEQAAREHEAVLAERRWIAGELHDSIAHQLTVISLHSQLLDDEATRATSQESIRQAARKALGDLRFVIGLADDTAQAAQTSAGDLAAAFAEAESECQAAGHTTVIEGDPNSDQIPRVIEIALARIVRESVTNILKYAGEGEIRFALQEKAGSIHLTVRSPLPLTPRTGISSSGTGLNRMAERILGSDGEFASGPDGDTWLVSVRLPIG